MKKLFLICLFSFSTAILFAQKKLVPVQQSKLTGISLPTGSKQDKRMLSVAGAEILLEMESKKVNAVLSSTEVLVLPTVAAGGLSPDALAQILSEQGWTVSIVDTDKQYAWLQKDNRNVLMYFSANKKEAGLYFAEASSAPVTLHDNKNENIQNIDTLNQSNQLQPVSNSGFAFNTTNFDDGWTSTVQENWVEVRKGVLKVLVHYPKEGTIFPADPGPMTNTAWDILVAPRYSNLKNYKTSYISTYDRPYLGMGYATENATGKNVFIVFFHQGILGWLEFVAPDKNSFIQQFKFDPETIQWDSNTDLVIPLVNMNGYNRFAVAASDFNGKWTSNFTGIQQLYNAYTGQYAGMNIHQSNEEFIFGAGNTYNWKLLAANGVVGKLNFAEVKSTGQFSVPNNWQIYFSKIETGPKTFHAFWSCIKGARILNLLDANSPGSGIYTKYGLAK
jgi:hypothetical protein